MMVTDIPDLCSKYLDLRKAGLKLSSERSLGSAVWRVGGLEVPLGECGGIIASVCPNKTSPSSDLHRSGRAPPPREPRGLLLLLVAFAFVAVKPPRVLSL